MTFPAASLNLPGKKRALACSFAAEALTATCHRCSSPRGSGGELHFKPLLARLHLLRNAEAGHLHSSCAYFELADCKARVAEVSSLREGPRLPNDSGRNKV